MKTNHTISFPSTIGELIVYYNFTEASLCSQKELDRYLDATTTKERSEIKFEGTPAEVEITDIGFAFNAVWAKRYSFTDIATAWLKTAKFLKEAVYTEHMRLLKEKEDAEAKKTYRGYPFQANSWKGLYIADRPYQHIADGPQHTSALHEHAKAMFDLGQKLLKDSIKQCCPPRTYPLDMHDVTDSHINKEKQQLELIITEPEQLYPYSAEIPACVQQKGIYVKMPKGVPLPDHILDVGNHLEQPETE
jgi:hypothetical protein